MKNSVTTFAPDGQAVATETVGFVMFPVALIDDSMPAMSGSTWKVLTFFVRKTAGWDKDCDALSLSQIEKGTGLERPTVVKAVKELLALGLAVAVSRGYRRVTVYEIPLVKKMNQCRRLVKDFTPQHKGELSQEPTVTTGALNGYPDSDDPDVVNYHAKRDNVFSRACAGSYENMETVLRITGRDAL